MLSDACLYPELLEEVVETLLSSDIINEVQVTKLKSECRSNIDTNISIEVRHKEARKQSLIDFGDEQMKNFNFKRNVAESFLKTSSKTKDLKTVDKEIATTKRQLQVFKNELSKKNEIMRSSIVCLDDDRNKNANFDSTTKLMDEDETKYYFNVHLDQLESSFSNSLQDKTTKAWKPFELDPYPIINVKTSLKTIDFKQCGVKFDDEEVRMMTLCGVKHIQLSGKAVKFVQPSIGQKEIINTVQNSSPSQTELHTYDQGKVITNKKIYIVMMAIKKWKSFVEKQRYKQLEEEKKIILRIYVLRKYFDKWVVYVKSCKSEKQKILAHEPKSDIEITHVKNSSICVELSDFDPQQRIIKPSLGSKSYTCHPKQVKTDSVNLTRNFKTLYQKVDGSNCGNGCNNQCKSQVNLKFISPEDVGLNHFQTFVEKPSSRSDKNNKIKTFTPSSSNPLIRKGHEPFENRFVAQEKIIKQQLDLIEKQKKTILDLKSHILETESKLNLKVAEHQLLTAPVAENKKINLLLKPILNGFASEQKISGNKIGAKAEKLTKTLLERQEHCRKLAEITKQRKKRIEEKREKLILEEEQKEKKKKEEENKQRSLKIKTEQKQTLERKNKALAIKIRNAELNEKAKKHYNQLILKKAFNVLKQFSSEIFIKTKQCHQIYERKLLRGAFSVWRTKVKLCIDLKTQQADKFYCDKLLSRCWRLWLRLQQEFRIKIQVTENMFVLKLQQRMFQRWLAYTANQYLQTCFKIELAERLHRKHLLKHSFDRWKEFPRLMHLEREKDQRHRAWFQAVRELIPDFKPTITNLP